MIMTIDYSAGIGMEKVIDSCWKVLEKFLNFQPKTGHPE